MFKEGWGSENKDHFDQNAQIYQLLKSLSQVRLKDKVLTKGDLEVLHSSEVGSGILAFKRTYKKQTVFFVVF